MKEFEDLKSGWNNQPHIQTTNKGSKNVIKTVLFIKRKQQITNMVLGVTIMVLISFFFYIKAYKNTTVALALFLMIGPLLVRIFMEYISRKELKKINIATNSKSFKLQMIDYYKKRIRTHRVFTPIIGILYIIGFIMLLPFFKENLSIGLYTYIKFSGAVIFIILTLFIRKEILKELKILKQLCD